MSDQKAPPISAEVYLQRLDAISGGRFSTVTIKHHHGTAARFLDEIGVKREYTKADIIAYINRLVADGYRVTSIRTMLRSVHSLFLANGLTWPVHRQDTYLGMQQGPPETPLLSTDEVARMITGAKGAKFPDLQITILSTIYGFRNTELAAIISQGMDGKTVSVQTAKGGQRRVHQIPGDLSVPLKFHGKSYSGDSVHKAFERVMERYVRPQRHREGWHSLRRNVVTGLFSKGASETLITKFMGWGKPATVFTYFHPTDETVDAEIYRLHPFLPLWLA